MELGRININPEIALLYCYTSKPRSASLDQAFHFFSYLKSQGRSKIVIYPHKNEFDGEFLDHDWQIF